jgi:hypothetical protein
MAEHLLRHAIDEEPARRLGLSETGECQPMAAIGGKDELADAARGVGHVTTEVELPELAARDEPASRVPG